MERKKNKKVLWEVLIIVATVFVGTLASWLYGKTIYEMIRLVILAVIASGCVVFSLETAVERGQLLYDNVENLHRFSVVYGCSLVCSVIFPLLPESGWIFLVIYISLMLFSNQLTGLCAGSGLLLITLLLYGSNSAHLFVLYFFGGMVGIILFSSLHDTFKVGLVLFVSLMIQFLCLCINSILMVNESLHIGMILIPAANILICLILLLILLRYFSVTVINKTRDLYMDINDPECPLLVKLKEHSKDEYYHAVHTAYLCDRIAKRLSMDDAVAKAGGYYHKIGILLGENNWANTKAILDEYSYPETVHEILKEYLDKDQQLVKKETVVLMIADTVISSISYLFSKDSKAQVDYDKLIQAIFKKKYESGLFNYSMISLGELEEMKKILSEERLYYDFLR